MIGGFKHSAAHHLLSEDTWPKKWLETCCAVLVRVDCFLMLDLTYVLAQRPLQNYESTVSRIPKKSPDEGQSSWVSAIANCNVQASVQVAASSRASLSTVILQSGADVHSASTSRFPKDLFRLEVGSSNWPALMLKLQLASRQTLYSEFVATLTPQPNHIFVPRTRSNHRGPVQNTPRRASRLCFQLNARRTTERSEKQTLWQHIKTWVKFLEQPCW